LHLATKDKHGFQIENGGIYLVKLDLFQAIIALFFILHVEDLKQEVHLLI